MSAFCSLERKFSIIERVERDICKMRKNLGERDNREREWLQVSLR